MRIVDVCAFYTPHGGGVRTYVEQKLAVGPKLGHEIIILAPGDRDEVIERGPECPHHHIAFTAVSARPEILVFQ